MIKLKLLELGAVGVMFVSMSDKVFAQRLVQPPFPNVCLNIYGNILPGHACSNPVPSATKGELQRQFAEQNPKALCSDVTKVFPTESLRLWRVEKNKNSGRWTCVKSPN